jgi:8-oxo-dGTP diphosphatase
LNEKLESSQHLDEKRFRVVAALIRKNGKVLLTQRWPGKHLGLTWEFPGGKVESGESDEEALKRELQEELGIEVEIGSCCFETCHGYGNREVHLLIYRCKLVSGTPQPIDVKAIEWADESALLDRSFPPADLPFVQEIVAGRIGRDDDINAPTKMGTPVVAALDDDDEEEEISFKPAQVVRRPVK